MKPLIVLLGTFIISITVLKLVRNTIDYRLAGRIAMAAMLTFTAIGHFVFIDGMKAIIPDFLPLKTEMVYATGILELVFAVALFYPNYSVLTGWALIIFFIAILPANIKAAMHHINYQTGATNGHGLTYLWFRVPLQAFFIAWVYLSTLKQVQ
ncbi:DoxX family protein [Snuella sedimenti]|uniref:DoxX family membrane protein n=1 Tax=Snuella sedimenti TaxID=2798802 RepID=A0A8J7IFZ0_9FLAO|nr:hypothetical protein [Snuella sedimenti]MBJ6368537.1 hypothetical protein [Snuella sedimenti]